MMGKYCSMCGAPVADESEHCPHCGNPIKTNSTTTKVDNRKTLARLSLFFGITGFTPLAMMGSVAGLIVTIIALKDKETPYRKRLKFGLVLNIISFTMWLLAFAFAMAMLLEQQEPFN